MTIRMKLKLEFQKRTKQEDESSSNLMKKTNLSSKKEENSENMEKEELKISFRKQNIISRLAINRPLSFGHVCNYFNLVGINEKAVQDKEHQESYFRSMFYVKHISTVEVRRHGVILNLQDLTRTSLPLAYWINRYKSFGENDFFQIACRMESLVGSLNKLKKDYANIPEEDYHQPLSKYLESMNGKMYMLKIMPNKLVISRSLLEYLGYDVDLYAIQAVKYRSIFQEIVSSQNYSQVLKKTFDNYQNLIHLIKNQITAVQFYQATSMEYIDCLIAKDESKIKCKLKLSLLNPMISCIEVEQILCEEEETKSEDSFLSNQKKLIAQECSERRKREVAGLRKIIRLPKNMLPENQPFICSYRQE